MVDSRDLVIEMLAHSEATLLDELVEVVAQRDAYRLLAHEAIHHCHAKHVELARLRIGHERLIGEYRAFRAHATIDYRRPA
jgi:hypothetical protein